MPEQCVVQFADMIRFGRDLDALSSLGANFQDAFSGVNVASKCSQLPEVIRLFFVVYEDLSMSIACCIHSWRSSALMSCKCKCV